eukprot:261534_1
MSHKNKTRTIHYMLCILIIIAFLSVFIYSYFDNNSQLYEQAILNFKQSSNQFNIKNPSKQNIISIHSMCDNHKLNPMKYKYLHLLLTDLHNIFNGSYRSKQDITSSKIDNFVSDWKYAWNSGYAVRLKYYNNILYANYHRKGYIYREYNGMFIYWFYEMINKYKHIINIPWFDIVFWTHDYNFYTHKWENKSEIPVFFSDRIQVVHNKINLYLAPRSYVKTWITQQFIKNGITNVSKEDERGMYRFNEFYSQYLKAKNKEISFVNKTNKAVFFGTLDYNTMRKRLQYICNAYCIVKGSYSDDDHPVTYNVSEEMKYKFQILIDGFSTRDAAYRQIKYDSVIVKYKSEYYEFWYYDLIAGINIHEFKDKNEFKSIM